ncbi:wax ester/triacylglycerol synthase domain-containing protein [Rhizomonospora bruguierae]|uniref:wax ester/triacylglycerol synthase domain-containing protein n=1 Tax=Rhizomonospora bruguierae TaxID=1581705 RepID=UPI001BCCEE7F|nr:wax ester/triacylglycerol synthase domain-containing protein [Micromonospora sp. NBRC 107566]
MTARLTVVKPEPARVATGPPPARRVLVVSAEIGGGHDATGRALEERVARLWPGSAIRWVDTLAAMGPGVGRAIRRTYVTNVDSVPWLYEFFYASVWRHRWFGSAAKRFVGAWAGRRLAGVVEGFDPDLILSTYPLGSAGLAWLRRHRGLAVPVGAWISDFAPHPFWVYPQLDLNLVVHDTAAPLAAAAAPGAAVAVCPPPVVEAFHPGDPVPARQRLGLDPHRPVVLVACGSLGFGEVEEAVRALAGDGPPGIAGDPAAGSQVVVVCGRNERLAGRLAALDLPPDRLTVLGWADTMPDLLRAADVLVNNAGGATALEAVASGTPVVMYRPIAAHGVANAALMTVCGLAETCHTPAALATTVRAVLRRRRVGAGPRTAVENAPDLGLRALSDAPPPPAARPANAWPLRAPDAFFLHVESPTVVQQVGTVLDIGPIPDRRPLRRDDVLDVLRRRLPAMVTLRRRPVRTASWRRAGWVVERHVDPAAHVDERPVPGGGEPAAARLLDEFWSQPMPLDAPPWRMLLLTGLPGGRTRLAIKMHHSLGDGMAVLATMRRILDPHPGGTAQGSMTPRRETVAGRIRGGLRAAVLTGRGLVRLAFAGPAPRSALNRPLTTPDRRLVTATLPMASLNRAARACDVRVSELLYGLVAEALRATYPAAPVPDRLRATVPVARTPRERWRTHGNWTGAVALDLPLGPMSTPARAALIRDRLRRSLDAGEQHAAGLVMRAIGTLPAPAHAWLARRLYTNRFTNVNVSYVIGTRKALTLAGAPVVGAVPVIALAEGVPVGIGAMRWEDTIGVGVLLDSSLAGFGEAFTVALHAALDGIAGEPPAPAAAAMGEPSDRVAAVIDEPPDRVAAVMGEPSDRVAAVMRERPDHAAAVVGEGPDRAAAVVGEGPDRAAGMIGEAPAHAAPTAAAQAREAAG